jgi:hypothetical protein
VHDVNRLRSYKLSPIAWVLLVLLLAAIALALLASGTGRDAGLIGGVIVLIMIIGGSPFGFGRGFFSTTGGLRGRRIANLRSEVLDEAASDETAWERERERRERDGR